MVPFFKFGIQNTQLRILFQAIDFSLFLKEVDERLCFYQNCNLIVYQLIIMLW